MRFSIGRTFNSHDTQVHVDGRSGRWLVDQSRGVKARCELSLNSLLRYGPKGASDTMVTKDLNRRLGANYSVSDVRYALERLVTENIVKVSRKGKGEDSIYRAGKSALDHWRRLPKEH